MNSNPEKYRNILKITRMSWKPMNMNDFENHIVDIHPDKEYLFNNELAREKDSKRRKIMDRRSAKEDRELSLISQLHETNVIPKVPGRLLNSDDLAKSDPSTEAVRMMRSIGMQPSINEQLKSSTSINFRKKQPKVIYDRNMPIFLDESFFEFRLRPKKDTKTSKV